MTETTAANPELLADQVSSLLVQPLEAASVVLSSGPRIFDTSGVLRIRCFAEPAPHRCRPVPPCYTNRMKHLAVEGFSFF